MLLIDNDINDKEVRSGKKVWKAWKVQKWQISRCQHMEDIYQAAGLDWKSLNKQLGRRIDIPTELFASKETNDYMLTSLLKNAKFEKHYKIYKPQYREGFCRMDWANLSPRDSEEDLGFGFIKLFINPDKRLWNEAHKDKSIKMHYMGEEIDEVDGD